MLFVVGSPPPGITTLIVLSFLGIGLNSLGIGVLGEYLGRTYTEVKQRPLYLTQETVNVHEAEAIAEHDVPPIASLFGRAISE